MLRGFLPAYLVLNNAKNTRIRIEEENSASDQIWRVRTGYMYVGIQKKINEMIC
jgi:hypothetical protein